MMKNFRITSAFLSLLTSVSALAALVLATPVVAQTPAQVIKDRIAQACSVSDTDLVGKRLARECRVTVRNRVEGELRIAAAGVEPEPAPKLAARR